MNSNISSFSSTSNLDIQQKNRMMMMSNSNLPSNPAAASSSSSPSSSLSSSSSSSSSRFWTTQQLAKIIETSDLRHDIIYDQNLIRKQQQQQQQHDESSNRINVLKTIDDDNDNNTTTITTTRLVSIRGIPIKDWNIDELQKICRRHGISMAGTDNNRVKICELIVERAIYFDVPSTNTTTTTTTTTTMNATATTTTTTQAAAAGGTNTNTTTSPRRQLQLQPLHASHATLETSTTKSSIILRGRGLAATSVTTNPSSIPPTSTLQPSSPIPPSSTAAAAAAAAGGGGDGDGDGDGVAVPPAVLQRPKMSVATMATAIGRNRCIPSTSTLQPSLPMPPSSSSSSSSTAGGGGGGRVVVPPTVIRRRPKNSTAMASSMTTRRNWNPTIIAMSDLRRDLVYDENLVQRSQPTTTTTTNTTTTTTTISSSNLERYLDEQTRLVSICDIPTCHLNIDELKELCQRHSINGYSLFTKLGICELLVEKAIYLGVSTTPTQVTDTIIQSVNIKHDIQYRWKEEEEVTSINNDNNAIDNNNNNNNPIATTELLSIQGIQIQYWTVNDLRKLCTLQSIPKIHGTLFRKRRLCDSIMSRAISLNVKPMGSTTSSSSTTTTRPPPPPPPPKLSTTTTEWMRMTTTSTPTIGSNNGTGNNNYNNTIPFAEQTTAAAAAAGNVNRGILDHPVVMPSRGRGLSLPTPRTTMIHHQPITATHCGTMGLPPPPMFAKQSFAPLATGTAAATAAVATSNVKSQILHHPRLTSNRSERVYHPTPMTTTMIPNQPVARAHCGTMAYPTTMTAMIPNQPVAAALQRGVASFPMTDMDRMTGLATPFVPPQEEEEEEKYIYEEIGMNAIEGPEEHDCHFPLNSGEKEEDETMIMVQKSNQFHQDPIEMPKLAQSKASSDADSSCKAQRTLHFGGNTNDDEMKCLNNPGDEMQRDTRTDMVVDKVRDNMTAASASASTNAITINSFNTNSDVPVAAMENGRIKPSSAYPIVTDELIASIDFQRDIVYDKKNRRRLGKFKKSPTTTRLVSIRGIDVSLSSWGAAELRKLCRRHQIRPPASRRGVSQMRKFEVCELIVMKAISLGVPSTDTTGKTRRGRPIEEIDTAAASVSLSRIPIPPGSTRGTTAVVSPTGSQVSGESSSVSTAMTCTGDSHSLEGPEQQQQQQSVVSLNRTMRPMSSIVESPYQVGASAEVGEAVFEQMLRMLSTGSDGACGGTMSTSGVSAASVATFGGNLANEMVRARKQIESSNVMYESEWKNGKIHGMQFGFIPKPLLLLCLSDRLLAPQTISHDEDAKVLRKIVVDLRVHSIVKEAIKVWKCEEVYGNLSSCNGNFVFTSHPSRFDRCGIFVARTYRCMKHLKWMSLSGTLLEKVHRCLDLMNLHIRDAVIRPRKQRKVESFASFLGNNISGPHSGTMLAQPGTPSEDPSATSMQDLAVSASTLNRKSGPLPVVQEEAGAIPSLKRKQTPQPSDPNLRRSRKKLRPYQPTLPDTSLCSENDRPRHHNLSFDSSPFPVQSLAIPTRGEATAVDASLEAPISGGHIIATATSDVFVPDTITSLATPTTVVDEAATTAILFQHSRKTVPQLAWRILLLVSLLLVLGFCYPFILIL